MPSRRARLHAQLHRNRALAAATKVVVTLVGLTVLAAGVVMMVTPGPGLVAIIAGLAILATEWEWADRWLVVARRKLAEARGALTNAEPAVRRRRLAVGAIGTAVVAGLAATYLVLDLPGM